MAVRKIPEVFAKYLDPVMSSLNAADPKLAAAILSREHPQTIAMALAHTLPAQSAQILKLLPESLQQESILRIARLERVDAEQVAELDETLHRTIQMMQGQGSKKVGGKDTLVQLLGKMSSDEQKLYLEKLQETDPELAEQVSSMLVTMRDLLRLDVRDIQRILTEIPLGDWALALRTESEATRSIILKNLPERRAAELGEELERPRKLSDVRAAQARIIEALRKYLN
jgi:flagellar motor switch protein FliG